MTTSALLLPSVIFVPILGATIALLVPRRAAGVVVVLTHAALLVVVSLLVAGVYTEGPTRHALGGWPPPLGISLELGAVGALFLVTSLLVGVFVSVYAYAYLPRQKDSPPAATRWYWPLWLLLLTGLNGIAVSGDLFNLYVCLEIVGLSAVALVGLSGQKALVASVRYLFVSLLAATLYLMAVALLYGDYGVVDLREIGARVTSTAPSQLALALIVAALLLKTAILPLHFWLPPAHGGALSPISAILSGLVVKASFLLLVRLWLTAFPSLPKAAVAELLGALGAAAIVWGSLEAIRQERLKMLVAYSTVAQLGYLLLAFPLARYEAAAALAWRGSLLFLLSHAVAKGAAFLAVGNMQYAAQHDHLEGARGNAVHLPVSTLAFAFAGVGLIGLPPSGNFVGKWLLLSAAVRAGRFDLALVMVAGTLLAAVYVFGVIRRSMRDVDNAPPPPHEQHPSRLMSGAALLLGVLALLLGFLAWLPLSLLDAELPLPPAQGASP